MRGAPLALETYIEVLKRAQLIEEVIGDESGPQSQSHFSKNKQRLFNRQGGRTEDKRPRTEEPPCPICHKNHGGWYRCEGKPCHNCGEYEHF